jgi:hypothetical protein
MPRGRTAAKSLFNALPIYNSYRLHASGLAKAVVRATIGT